MLETDQIKFMQFYKNGFETFFDEINCFKNYNP